MKMDVSKFKKVSSDDKKTILKHPRGHQIVIAHGSVSQSTRKQLQELPGYADGGDVSPWDKFKNDASDAYQQINGPETVESPQSGIDFASQYNAPANQHTAITPPLGDKQAEYKNEISQYPVPEAQQDPAVPAGANRAPAESSMVPQEDNPSTQNEPPTAAIQAGSNINPADTQAAEKDKTAASDYQKGFEDYHREKAQWLGHEDAAWQHDLQNGHVSQETYHDLFAKRDTLGKIGMLFGLLVSGAGAGLAHQSSSVLDAMNKEIEGDYKAQTDSKSNAQNYLRIHQQQALNEAQIKLQAKQGNLTDAQAKAELAQADINAQGASLMKMNRAALHNLVLQVQKMPPGEQRSQAEAALAMVSAGVDQKNFNIADVAAGKGALAKMLGGGDGQSNTTLLKTIPGMEGAAKDIEEKSVPGFGRASIPVPKDIRDQLLAQKQYDEKAKEYVDFARKHSKNWANLDLKQRATIANTGAAMGANLQGLSRMKNQGGVWKPGEQEFIEQTVPNQPAKWSAAFDAIPKVEQTIRDNQSDMKNTASGYKLTPPAAQQSYGAPQPSAHPQSQTSKSGRPMVQKNGKWYYAK